MKEQIYQNGFYALIGLLLGIICVCLFDQPCPCQKASSKDTLIIYDTTIIEKHIALNEKNVLKELKKQDIKHPHIVLAQAKLESGNFKSKLTKTHNNFLGIKRGKDYAKYDSWNECITDYKERVQYKYKGGDYYEFLQNIRYAENPNYVQILKELVVS